MSNISKEAIARTLELLEKYKQAVIDFDVSSPEKEIESRNALTEAKQNIERSALLLAEQVRELTEQLRKWAYWLKANRHLWERID